MPVVEPVLNLEKLRQLLDEGHESASLDYKRTISFDDKGNIATADFLEITKDIAAMQVDGGFIVIGADDQGNLTGAIRFPIEKVRACFDESRLRGQLKKYIPELFDVRSITHEIDDKIVVLIYVGVRTDGFCIFNAEGNYNGKSAFRKGEVYARHGTSSEPWNQQDIARIFERLLAQRKETWRKELSEDMAKLDVSGDALRIARGPINALTWQLDGATFGQVVLELFRAKDVITPRAFIDRAVLEAGSLAETKDGASDDLETILDRLFCFAALAVNYEQPEWLQRVIKGVARIYNIGLDNNGYRRQLKGIQTERLWLSIVERILALGALLVRLENWEGVKSLVLRPRRDGDFERYLSWIPHATDNAAQSMMLWRNEGGQQIQLSLLSLAREHVMKHECLRPDVLPDSEEIMNSLCQFDFLASITAVDTAKLGKGGYYTSFARFNTGRTEPIVVRLIEDVEMKQHLFPYDDHALAVALAALIKAANHLGARYTAWSGFDSPVIKSFIDTHLTDDEWRGLR